MSQSTPLGAIRPISSRDRYQLNRALVSCDVAACLLENALQSPWSVTEDRLELLAFSLREAAAAIDPAAVQAFISNDSKNQGRSSKVLMGLYPADAVLSAHGFDRPQLEAQISRAHPERGFFVSAWQALWACRAGRGNPCRSSSRSVNPHGTAHPFDSGAAVQPPQLEETLMAHTPTGAIRPIPTPTCEVLQGLLVELEAAADLVEQLLVNGPDAEVITALIQSLDEMTGLLKGGRHE